MKKILYILGIALAAIGCTKDLDLIQLNDNVITITSSIATRVVDSQWEKGDEIGVYMTTDAFGDEGSNALYSTSDASGDFTSDNPLYFPISGTVELFAYYPYVEEVDLSAYCIDSQDQIDLLSATASDVEQSATAVPMTFEHLLSKVSLTIKEGDGLEVADLTNLEIIISGISTTATFDVLNSEVNSSSLGETSELYLTTTESGTSSSGIVIPQELNGVTLYFITENYGTFSATISTSEFKVGMEYTYDATINRLGVEITESNIDSWNEYPESGTADLVDLELKSDGKYYINSALGLSAFRDLVNGNVNTTATTYNVTFSGEAKLDIDGVLSRDIDIEDVCSETSGISWTPIGYTSQDADNKWQNYYYNGTFDGGGHEISGLYINNSAKQQSLFRFVGTDAVICNLGVSGSVTRTSTGAIDATEIGGIVAYNCGFIINCYSLVDVEATINNVGGIAGYSEGNVVNCFNQGSVKGSVNVGGIVGYNYEGAYVGYCYSTGTIDLVSLTGSDPRVGGVVGYNYSTTAEAPTIKGSFCLNNTTYSIGQVETNASSGGVTGNVCTEEYLKSEVFATIINNGASTYNDNNTSPVPACAWIDNSTSDYPTLDFGGTPEYSWIYDIIYNGGTYQIYSGLGLQAFAALVNGEDLPSGVVTSGGDDYFTNIVGDKNTTINGQLMEDVDLEGAEWTPIGIDYNSSDNLYCGKFNGGGYLVSGFKVTNFMFAGLFGYIGNGAEISNLGVDGSVSGEYAGGVVGECYGDIINCYNKGDVSSSSSSGYAGGVVGRTFSVISSGTIYNCYNTGTVNGYFAGGVVGYYDSYAIAYCYNTGTVNGDKSADGVVGYYDSYAIANCYNTGTVNGDKCAGGVVGYSVIDPITNCYNTGVVIGGESGSCVAGGVVGLNEGATITNCYSTGVVSGSYAGGVAGVNGGFIINCYWDSSTADSGDGDGDYDTTTEMSTAEMQGEDFVTTLNNNAYTYNESSSVKACAWMAVSGDSPTLDFDADPTYNPDIVETEDGSYEIYTAKGLTEFASKVSGGDLSVKITLMSDIDLEDVEWTPIGTASAPYQGTFDGGGYLISGLNVSDAIYAGLFGNTYQAEISNLGVDGYVSGNSGSSSCVGGIIGYAMFSNITNCYNTADVVGNCSQSSVGGIVGYIRYTSNIIGCYNSGTISTTVGSSRVGGIAGKINDSSQESYMYMTACYNIGTLTDNGKSSVQVGGLAGYASYKNVTSCYTSTTTALYGGYYGGNDDVVCYTYSDPSDYYTDNDEGSPLSLMNSTAAAATVTTGVENSYVDNSGGTLTPTLYWQK